MRPLRVVKFYVTSDTFCELLLGFVLYSIDFSLLHEGEKRLHDCVIVGLTRRRERLDNLVHA